MQPRTYSQEGLKYLFTQVNELLFTAAECNGYVYGGFVRDVISKVVRCDFGETEVKDVDIWFQKEEDKQRFLQKTTALKLPSKPYVNSAGCDAEVYILRDSFGDSLLFVDLVVSKTFPVFDFDVNTLIWEPKSRSFDCYGDGSVTEILSHITKKEAHLTQEYQALLTDSTNTTTASCARSRVYHRFLRKGWSLFVDGKKVEVYDEKLRPIMTLTSVAVPWYLCN